MGEIEKERRKKENQRILEMMKRGESLATVDVGATWYPPRPIIKKDLTRLYSDKLKDSKDEVTGE